MRLREERGFTLIEVMVVAAIIAVLAGILVPMVFKEVDEAKISRANADCKSIMSAMMVFYKDTGKWPYTDPENNAGPVSLMCGKGDVPADGPDIASIGTPWTRDVPVYMAYFLRDNPNNPNVNIPADYPNWKGPYMTTFDPDPWGHAYIVNAYGLLNNQHVFVLSAGPNGLVETPIEADSLVGDDIGYRIQ